MKNIIHLWRFNNHNFCSKMSLITLSTMNSVPISHFANDKRFWFDLSQSRVFAWCHTTDGQLYLYDDGQASEGLLALCMEYRINRKFRLLLMLDLIYHAVLCYKCKCKCTRFWSRYHYEFNRMHKLQPRYWYTLCYGLISPRENSAARANHYRSTFLFHQVPIAGVLTEAVWNEKLDQHFCTCVVRIKPQTVRSWVQCPTHLVTAQLIFLNNIYYISQTHAQWQYNAQLLL